MSQSGSLGDSVVVLLTQWVLAATGGPVLAATVLAIVTGMYWTALFLTTRIVPFVDERGDRLKGTAVLRHANYRWKVWLGHVSFFPYMSDHSWWSPLRFHFILMSLIGFGEVFGITLNEGERPLHLSLLMLFLPSLLMHGAGIFPRKASARVGIAKRRGSGPVTKHRFFTDEEILRRIEAEARQREATQRFWERQRER